MVDIAKWTDFSNLDRELLISTINAKLPRWVTLLLVVCIAWQLARILWMLIPAGGADSPIVVPAEQVQASGPAGSQANVDVIAQSHLFGQAETVDEGTAPPPVSGPAPDELPDARVTFSLKGTVAASDPDFSVAIISDNNDEKVYRIGSAIQSGTTLHEVHTDLVVLNQGGALSKLMLPKEFPQGTPSVRRPTVAAATPSESEQSIQNVVAQNVSKLADVIRPTPYFVGGQQQGYRVYPGRDRKQFAALGLRPGDLIKDIDGASLTDPKQAMQIFQNLGNAEEVSVTVERNGQPQTLVLKTSQLAFDQ